MKWYKVILVLEGVGRDNVLEMRGRYHSRKECRENFLAWARVQRLKVRSIDIYIA